MEPPTKVKAPPADGHSTKDSERISIDAKVVYGIVGCCVLVGIALLVAGGVVFSQREEGSEGCICDSDLCCEISLSKCSECWCHEPGVDEIGFCGNFETSVSDNGALGIATAGLVVCVICAAMLVTMRWCKEWSEKNLHVRYPAVTPVDHADERA